MGFPSEGVEKTYRNPMSTVQRFFNTRHKDKYMIYNVCSEKHYSGEKFNGACEHSFVWDDHNPPPMKLIEPMVEHMVNFLSKGSDYIVAVHCKAGKGGTARGAVFVPLRRALGGRAGGRPRWHTPSRRGAAGGTGGCVRAH